VVAEGEEVRVLLETRKETIQGTVRDVVKQVRAETTEAIQASHHQRILIATCLVKMVEVADGLVRDVSAHQETLRGQELDPRRLRLS